MPMVVEKIKIPPAIIIKNKTEEIDAVMAKALNFLLAVKNAE